MWASFVTAFQFFLVFLVFHICVCQLTSSYKFVYKTIFSGLFVLLFLAGYEHQRSQVDYVSLFFFATLWFAYLFLTLFLIRSASLKILMLIEKHPRGELHLNEIPHVIKADQELKNRLFLMKTNNMISGRERELALTKRAKRMLSFVSFLKRLFALSRP